MNRFILWLFATATLVMSAPSYAQTKFACCRVSNNSCLGGGSSTTWTRTTHGRAWTQIDAQAQCGTARLFWTTHQCPASQDCPSSNVSRPTSQNVRFENFCGKWLMLHVQDDANGLRQVVVQAGQSASVFVTGHTFTYRTIDDNGNQTHWKTAQNTLGDGQRLLCQNEFNPVSNNLTINIDPPRKAIALAWNSNGGWSYWVANTVSEAQSSALSECNSNHGNCRLAKTITRDEKACLVIVESGNRDAYYGTDPSTSGAEAVALNNCRSKWGSVCRVTSTRCNY